MVFLSYIRGSLLPYLQSWTREYDPLRGFVYRAEFKGLSEAQMESLQNDFIQQGIACALRYVQGVSYLEVVDSTQQYTLDDWQLEGSSFTMDLFSHPEILDIFGPYSSRAGWNSFTAMRQDLENWTNPDDLYNNLITSGFTIDDAAEVVRFYLLYQRGTTEFENDFDGSGYVLRHTTNVSNRWQQNIADFNVGMIYTTAELLSEVQDSSLWINPLPARLVYKLANIPAPDPQENYFWGWKKSRSTETTAANNRVNIMTFYTLALWSTDLYDTID